MNTPSKQHESWDSCDSGYLVGLSARAKSARRKETALRRGAVVLAVLCFVGVGIWSSGYFSQPQESYFGGIACHEVQENMPGYMAGTLPAELSARIDEHLHQCPICSEMLQKMQSKQAAAFGHHGLWVCECPECQRQLEQTATRALHSADAGEASFIVYASSSVRRSVSGDFSGATWEGQLTAGP
jgi:hypothetical protein